MFLVGIAAPEILANLPRGLDLEGVRAGEDGVVTEEADADGVHARRRVKGDGDVVVSLWRFEG